MYTEKNYRTKKALKDDLQAGKEIRCYSPGPFPCPSDGKVCLEGPHYPEPHRWYASATVKNGVVIKVS